MQLRVLGCSGGIGAGLRTTALLVDEDVLIDCGSGVGELYLEDMSKIRHIFITHAHLDHTGFLPLLVDSIFERIKQPIIVHAQVETIAILQDHLFNWKLWPDFTRLPSEDNPVLKFEPMVPGTSCEVDGRQVHMIAVNHTVPAVAYRVESKGVAFAFSGDTSTNDGLWQALNAYPGLELLIVECAFSNRQRGLAQLARHYCPIDLVQDLAKLRHKPEVYLSHLKPGEEMTILSEVRAAFQQGRLKTLVGGEIFQL